MTKETELKQANQYFEEGEKLTEKAKFKEAIEVLEEASAIYKQLEEWEKWVDVNNRKAWSIMILGKYHGVDDYLHKVLEIGLRHLTREHSSVGTTLNLQGILNENKGNYDESIMLYQQALAIRIKNFGYNHHKTARILNNISNIYGTKGDMDMAIYYGEQALETRQLSLGSINAEVASSLNGLGISYSLKGDYNLAVTYFQKALDIYTKISNEQHHRIASTWNNMGMSYYEKGDYYLAIRYLKKSLSIYKDKIDSLHPSIASILTNLSSCYIATKELDVAIKQQQEALEIFKQKLGSKHPRYANALTVMGSAFIEKKEYTIAARYFEEAINILKQDLTSDPAMLASGLNNLGVCAEKSGDFEQAIDHYKKKLFYQRETFNHENPYIASTLTNIGHCCMLTGKKDEANKYYQQALIVIVNTFTDKNIYRNPTITELKDSYFLLIILTQKSQTFLQYHSPKKHTAKDLQAALSTIHLATNLISKIRQSYKAEGSKHTLAEKAANTYNLAIQIALKTAEVYQNLPSIPKHPEFTNIPHTLQGAKELAFDFTEQSKAILLLSSLKDSEAKAANIPSTLLEKEKQLKIELNYLDKSIATQEAKADQKDEKLLSKFQGEYFDYKQEYDQLIEYFEASYPEYYRLKYAVETASVEEIQAYLESIHSPRINSWAMNGENSPFEGGKGDVTTIRAVSNSALISYHIAEKSIYIFAITSNDYQIHTIEKPSNFTQLITNFQNAIPLANISEYIRTAGNLYDLLLQPILEKATKINKLIIIPHNELTTVAFDALIDRRKMSKRKRVETIVQKDFSALPYLVKDYNINYHYSATMLLHSVARQKQKPPKPASFVGFAPITFDGSGDTELALSSSRGKTKVMRSNRAGEKALTKLPSTENEVKEVFQLFEKKELDAEAFLYASANKQNLFDSVLNHKYVLIATHGYTQDGNAELSGIYLAPQVSDTYFPESDSSPNLQIPDAHKRFSKTSLQESINTQTHKNTNTNYLLHTSEAYHLQLDADLVVLSSCSSGVGKLVTGEGMMAINRGFLYAGASNIIFTYFDIPDASSGELVKALFAFILEGESYASALRKAKLQVIQQDLKTPEDWAGYALIGR